MGMSLEHGSGIGDAASVLFVGDADQLPSVESSKFLGDILSILGTGGQLACSESDYLGASYAPDGRLVAMASGGYQAYGLRSDRTAVCAGQNGRKPRRRPDTRLRSAPGIQPGARLA